MVRRIAGFSIALTFAAACTPDVQVHASRITSSRILAVRGEPAEARGGRPVTFTALVATPRGEPASTHTGWHFCLLPRPETESTSVASGCLADASDAGTALPSIGDATDDGTVTGMLPNDVCMRVGPQVPPAGPDMERMRAPTADFTGGWQVPVRIDLAVEQERETLFDRYRIHCQPPDVPGATAVAYATQYHENTNPIITAIESVAPDGTTDALTLRRTGTTTLTPAPSAPDVLRAGRNATLVVRWDAGSAERYVVIDPVTRALTTRTESIEVTWFTDNGYFERDRTGAQDANGGYSLDLVHLDDAASDATVWVVVRDERGGVDYGVVRVRGG